MTRRIALPPELPFFAGHFPGRPILPGVAQLAFVASAAGSPLAGVRTLRFRLPVGPGDVLELDLASDLRFAFTCRGSAVSAGVVVTGPAPALVPAGADRAGRGAADLLPHKPPARLVSTVVAASDAELEATAFIPADSPFAAGGRVPGFLALEIAAQAAAAFEALRRGGGRTGEPAVGYLVGARDATFDRDLPVGVPLAVRICLEALALPLARYAFEVAGSARGTISTYL